MLLRRAVVIILVLAAIAVPATAAAQAPYQVYVPRIQNTVVLVPAPGDISVDSYYTRSLPDGSVEVGGELFNNSLTTWFHSVVVGVTLRDDSGAVVGTAEAEALGRVLGPWYTVPFFLHVPVSGPWSACEITAVSYRRSSSERATWWYELRDLQKGVDDATGQYIESGLLGNRAGNTGSAPVSNIRLYMVVGEQQTSNGCAPVRRIALADLGTTSLAPGESTTYRFAFEWPEGCSCTQTWVLADKQ